MQKERYKGQKNRTLEPFIIQRSALLFRSWQPNFQSYLKNVKVPTSKFQGEQYLQHLQNSTWNILLLAQWPQKQNFLTF